MMKVSTRGRSVSYTHLNHVAVPAVDAFMLQAHAGGLPHAAGTGSTPAPAQQKAAAAFHGHTPAPPADNRNDTPSGIPQYHTDVYKRQGLY